MMVDRDKPTIDKSLLDPGSISCYHLGGRENLLKVEENQGHKRGRALSRSALEGPGNRREARQ